MSTVTKKYQESELEMRMMVIYKSKYCGKRLYGLFRKLSNVSILACKRQTGLERHSKMLDRTTEGMTTIRCAYLSTLKKSSLYRTLSEAKAKLNLLSEREYRALKMRRKVANSKRLPAKLRVCDRKGSYVAGIEVTSSETSDQDKSDSGLESCNSESTSECMYDSESSLSDGWELELYK